MENPAGYCDILSIQDWYLYVKSSWKWRTLRGTATFLICKLLTLLFSSWKWRTLRGTATNRYGYSETISYFLKMENPAGYCDRESVNIGWVFVVFLKMENPAGYCDYQSSFCSMANSFFLKMENPAGYCDFFFSCFWNFSQIFLKMENPAGYCDKVYILNTHRNLLLPENGKPCGVLRLMVHIGDTGLFSTSWKWKTLRGTATQIYFSFFCFSFLPENGKPCGVLRQPFFQNVCFL